MDASPAVCQSLLVTFLPAGVANLVQLLSLCCVFVTVFIMRLHIHGKLQSCVVVCCCGCCCCCCCRVPFHHILQVASCTLAPRGKLLVAAACEILIAIHRGTVHQWRGSTQPFRPMMCRAYHQIYNLCHNPI